MKIKAFTVEGPLPTEIPALREIEAAFPSQWMGFANIVIRHPTNPRYEREIDLIMVADDRVVMVDLKHWKGRLELVDGYWHQEGERKDKSPVEKMRQNVLLLRDVFKAESFKLGRPHVDGLVVLTHRGCDTSGLGRDAQAILRLDEFLRLKDAKRFSAHFTNYTPHSAHHLTDTASKEHVLRFFSPGRVFEPRRTRFSTYEAVDADPEFSTKLYAEYLARDVENPNFTALLKVWDFTGDDELRYGDERKQLLDRERSVIGHILDRNPDLTSLALRPRERDPELGPRHWELFDRDRHLRRLSRVAPGVDDLGFKTRVELAKTLSSHVANLHRTEVAHRDIGLHSIWIDAAHGRVSLSSFGAARFPERRTIGLLRAKLLGSGLVLPEDSGVVEEGTAYRQDVFLLGAAVWRLLGGGVLPNDAGVPNWATLSEEAKAFLTPSWEGWLGRCLEWDPDLRFRDAVEAHDALLHALQGDEGRVGAADLSSYETEIDPLADYPPLVWLQKARCRIYTTVVGDETLLVKNWPERMLGDRTRQAAKLVEFFARAERLRGSGTGRLPRVRHACLSIDGLFLLQDYFVGEPLVATDVTGWTTEQFQGFALRLVEAVAEVHELGLSHGDLSPGNVLIETGETQNVRLVDFLDFSTEAAGERTTLAYLPPDGGTDPFLRDRFAAATLLAETAVKVVHLDRTLLADLSKAFETCAKPEAPWATLKPFLDVLDCSGRAPAPRADLVVGFPSCHAPGPLLADDGEFHVVLGRDADEINIVSFDGQVVLTVERGTQTVKAVRQPEVRAQTVAWASRHKDLTFSGTVTLFRSAQVSVDGLDVLLSREEVTIWLEASGAGFPATARAPKPQPEDAGLSRPRFPTARFWEDQIRAEEMARPSLVLVDEIVSDLMRNVALAPHDSDAALEGVEDGDAVFFDGTRIGTVSAEFTNAGTLAIRLSGGWRPLKPGDILVIQPTQDAEGLRRRAYAVRRILQGRAPIRDLVGYFDPESKADPKVVGEPIKDGDLNQYGLNPDQIEAFHLLWTKGPVGFLQGPPGTGKTKFIAAFAHYALTKGNCRNVLLVSQSHEAVNTAAERIQELMEASEGGLDLLRVANDPDKVSEALRRSHVGAVHDQYVARFEAEAKERLCMIARRLGLPRPFAEDLFEALEGPVEIARQIERMRAAELEADEENAASLADRIVSLLETLDAQAKRFGIAVGPDAERKEVEEATVAVVLKLHDVRDMSAVKRLLSARETGREWVRTLRAKSRTLEEFLAGSRRLVCGTCVGVGHRRLRITEKTFDLVIIEEAARATSSELAVAMQSAHRVLLVGDHRQLPPTLDREVMRRLAVTTGITDEPELLRSDFERALTSRYGRLAGTALKRQYRMADEIGQLVSDVFYKEIGLITARDPPGAHFDNLPAPFDKPFAWIDSGTGLGEARRGFSYSNPGEAQMVVRLLEQLSVETDFLLRAQEDLREGEPLIGVICMYAQQRDLVRDMLSTSAVPKEMRPLIKVETVDSYQGKENRIVVVSLVRSNDRGQIGFLDRENRINVALSRAMDRLVVVGAAKLFRSSAGKLPEVLARIEAAGRLFSACVDRPEAA